MITRSKGFTLIELVVAITAGMVILALTATGVIYLREKARQIGCVNNLKSIGVALQLYFNDKIEYPETLTSMVPDYVTDSSDLICPSSRAPYDNFYIKRSHLSATDTFSIGCPYHGKNMEAVNLLLDGSSQQVEMSEVHYGSGASAVIITPGTTVNAVQTLSFSDGSTAIIQEGSASLVQSFDMGEGKLYSIIKIGVTGKVDVNVNSGSRFEVVTPAAIAGVRGTRMIVTASIDGSIPETTIEVLSGTATITGRNNEGMSMVNSGDAPVTIISDEPIAQQPTPTPDPSITAVIDSTTSVYYDPMAEQVIFSFSGSATDSDGNDSGMYASYEWTLVDPASNETTISTMQSGTYVLANTDIVTRGSYRLALTVTHEGESATTEKGLQIPNRHPVPSISSFIVKHDPPHAETIFTFVGDRFDYDTDDTVSVYEWRVTFNNTATTVILTSDDFSGSETRTDVQTFAGDTFYVDLAVIDNHGLIFDPPLAFNGTVGSATNGDGEGDPSKNGGTTTDTTYDETSPN
ncbi:MAG: FecR domain-containing protein [Candidatus Omnitrophica bacterium]|nr:FecR domain-containing protein [Candidatus Omnitrophota bacterium]